MSLGDDIISNSVPLTAWQRFRLRLLTRLAKWILPGHGEALAYFLATATGIALSARLTRQEFLELASAMYVVATSREVPQ